MWKRIFVAALMLVGATISVTAQDRALGQDDYELSRTKLVDKFKTLDPGKFGSFVPGVKTKMATQKKVLALTFDACGGPTGSGYDTALIDYLKKEKIAATLFISGTWIEKNDSLFRTLCQESLFEIENHGKLHQPCSITPESRYGIQATGAVASAVDEIEMNAHRIELYTHKKPGLYRPAAAAADEGCVAIARELKEKIVSYDVLSEDAVVGVSADLIRKNIVKKSRPGSIIIMHMNHPERNGFEALCMAVPILRNQGYTFVKLEGRSLVGKK